ncbi:uncharacterized protein [Battus philenor]|uniref:uncharacterized protein n=1 Tax=Battus philenor TaxID=42288 RepID=UPI0035CF27E9
MNRKSYLKDYANSIKMLRKECTEQGIDDETFKKLYFEALKSTINNNLQANQKKFFDKRKIMRCIFIFALIICSCYYIYNNFLCNLQEFIYPGLRLVRKISIPLVSLFPALTDLYQEPCLIQNPFFTIIDMDCWPCSIVNNIGQINDPQPVHQQNSAPFIYKTDQEKINMENLRNLYIKNKNLLEKETTKILMNSKFNLAPFQVFEDVHNNNNLYIWKINNINIARMLRQIIPRAKVVPKFGQSTERYIIIDSSQNKFTVPDTECNFAFILALSGTRTITLNPAEECKHQCKSLNVELNESYLLWYNWWYWRPVVQDSNGNETFIAHVGSYC